MKEIAKLKAKEEKKKLESEVDFVQMTGKSFIFYGFRLSVNS